MSPVTAPVQDRSRQTFDRLVKVGEELLIEKGFERASIREICGRAGLTTGAFYARFAKKEDLALHLLGRLVARLEGIGRSFREDVEALGIGAATRQLFKSIVDLYRTERGTLMGLTGLIRSSPAIRRAMQTANGRFVGDLAAGLEGRAAEIGHPDPATAIGLGFVTVLGSLREIVLHQHLFEEPYPFDEPTLVDELTRMLLGYLEVS